MSEPQIVECNGERFFVCDYTGALIRGRYYIPRGEDKDGCFATLPVLLRHLIESGIEQDEFGEVKDALMKHFHQPDIPVHPKLEKKPIGYDWDLSAYLALLPMGQSWLMVENRESVEDYEPPKSSKRRRNEPIKPVAATKKRNSEKIFRLQQGAYLASADGTRLTEITETARIARIFAKFLKSSAGSMDVNYDKESYAFFGIPCKEPLGPEEQPNKFVKSWTGHNYNGDVLVMALKQVDFPLLSDENQKE